MALLFCYIENPFLKVNLLKKFQSLGAVQIAKKLIKRLFKKYFPGKVFTAFFASSCSKMPLFSV
jgi:hypothetical protein